MLGVANELQKIASWWLEVICMKNSSLAIAYEFRSICQHI